MTHDPSPIMSPVTIKVKRHGPYTIALEEAAGIRIVDFEGNELVPEPGRAVVLCRCGGSATKPFCDGTHKRIGFLMQDAAGADAAAPERPPGGGP
jgi:3-phenylpropionate/trans-cinnamate dioxygenase ferredoxin subunit